MCSGKVLKRVMNSSGSTLTVRVLTICPYCSNNDRNDIYIKNSRCKDQEIDCPNYGGCGKTFILNQCYIKNMVKGDEF